VFRLSDPESVRYRQVLIAGVRRTRRERDQLRDREISEGRYRFTTLGREYESLPELADSCDDPYAVPTSGPAALTFKGLPLDEFEDLVANSPAYRQTTRILAPEPEEDSATAVFTRVVPAPIVHVSCSHPTQSFTWYVTEGAEQEDGDWPSSDW